MSATRDGKMWRCQFYYKDGQGVSHKKNKRGFKTKAKAVYSIKGAWRGVYGISKIACANETEVVGCESEFCGIQSAEKEQPTGDWQKK